MAGVRVVKVGGSLFDDAQTPGRLRGWLAAQPPRATVLIAGGGPLADALRRLDAVHRFPPETSHWLCVRALRATAALLHAWLPGSELVEAPDDVRSIALSPAGATAPARCVVFDVEQFLVTLEPRLPPPALPRDWSVTTDSIAARVAAWLAADELWLLKSTDEPAERDWRRAAHAGLVDEHFPLAAASLAAVRWCNLRLAPVEPAAERPD